MAFHSLFRATICIVFLSYFMPAVTGHARLLYPPSRASMWRFGFRYNHPDYNDNEGFCGGFNRQHQIFKSKCGVCGDPWLPVPRQHERGGKYYTGEITAYFKAGDVITAKIEVTANHKGFFEFRICVYDNPGPNDIERYENGSMVEVSQSCLDKHILQLANGQGTKYLLPPNSGMGFFNVDLKIPVDLHCNKCLFQWRYKTANSWGVDPSGKGCIGCGNQEEFKACADVIIVPSGTNSTTQEKSTFANDLTTNPKTQETSTFTNDLTTNPKTQETSTFANDLTTNPKTQETSTSEPWTRPNLSTVNHETTDVTIKETEGCRPTAIYAQVPGMTEWCEINCSQGYCPESHCQCN